MTFLVWRSRTGACGVGACGFWRYRMPPDTGHGGAHPFRRMRPVFRVWLGMQAASRLVWIPTLICVAYPVLNPSLRSVWFRDFNAITRRDCSQPLQPKSSLVSLYRVIFLLLFHLHFLYLASIFVRKKYCSCVLIIEMLSLIMPCRHPAIFMIRFAWLSPDAVYFSTEVTAAPRTNKRPTALRSSG